MSKKREATESSCEQETKGSVDLFEDGDNVKRTKLLSSIRLQDLPTEMLQCILVRAVVMEVKSLGLAKVAWKQKADLVVDRLRTVCSLWNDLLATNSFRNELNRTLDGTAQPAIRLEVLHQFRIQFAVFMVTTMNDEIFMLCRPNGCWTGDNYVINVCENTGVVLVVKDVIPLSIQPRGMEACSVSNCLYVLTHDDWLHSTIWRIAKNEGRSYNVSPLIARLEMSSPIFTVSTNGSLILVNSGFFLSRPVALVYDASGSLQHEIALTEEIAGPRRFKRVMQRPNGGNLVLLSSKPQLKTGLTESDTSKAQCGTELTEIDTRGRLVYRFKSGHRPTYELLASFADARGRIYLSGWNKHVRLVDAELHLLDFAGPHLSVPWSGNTYKPLVHFNGEKNEVVRISYSRSGKTRVFTVFRFTDA